MSDEDVVKMIGEKFAALKYLELNLKTMKADDAIAVLNTHLPGLRGVIKEVQDRDYRDDRVVKIIKF
jgi:hypothetical protein